MASMGDDQEENIEMWKIKKVRRRERFFRFLFSLSFGKKSVVGVGGVRRRRRR